MRTVRAAASAAASAAVLLSLAACGPLGTSASSGGATIPAGKPAATPAGRDVTTQAVQALALVQKKTGTVHSAAVESTLSYGNVMSMTMKGAYDWSDGVHSAMTMSFTGGRLASMLRKQGMSTTEQVRYTPDAYYVRMSVPAITAQLHGKHWIRYGWNDLSARAGASGSYVKGMAKNADPAQSVQLALSSPNVRKVGVENVRGVTATHYTGTLDTAQIADRQVPGVSAADRAKLREQLRAEGASTESIDLWVSKDGLPVKAVTRTTTKSGTMSATVYYAHFGLTVRVTAPPASDTADFAELTSPSWPAGGPPRRPERPGGRTPAKA
ncbi:hypothetical protein [Actinacidiphila acidipaludis]|uniref:Lipoprotein n=1 Tax=Actinacidiphila acidipaludis TaxID=2873382 RepID=A0ABS7Q5G7_9ACTN|nr:hypothetical protein [Streptomyces acidipaludis]MBY8878086.1 hypothetical protein [Streptomyces acidipaludis]